MKLEDLLMPSGFKDFMEINYSSTIQQMKEGGVSEIEFLDYLINSYEKILESIICNANKDESDITDKQLLSYRKSIEELKHRKSVLLDQKLINQKIELLTSQNKKPRKLNDNLLIDSKIINISERYRIANEVCDLRKNIDIKNISATEKHILLAHIIGCTQQVARELFNGTQQKRTPVRDDLINKYLKNLK